MPDNIAPDQNAMTALFLSLFGFGKAVAQGVIAWLSRRSLSEILCIIACSALFIDHVALLASHRHARKVESQLAKVVKLRLDDRTAFIKAQVDAATQNKARVASIEQQQQKVTNDVEANYRADLTRLRAEQLRPSAPSSAPHSPSSSAPVASPTGPNCEAVSLPPAELLQAQETELQLNALIDLVLQQSAIDPNTK